MTEMTFPFILKTYGDIIKPISLKLFSILTFLIYVFCYSVKKLMYTCRQLSILYYKL